MFGGKGKEKEQKPKTDGQRARASVCRLRVPSLFFFPFSCSFCSFLFRLPPSLFTPFSSKLTPLGCPPCIHLRHVMYSINGAHLAVKIIKSISKYR